MWVDVDTHAAADRQLASLGAGLTPEDLKKAADRLAAMIDADDPEPTDADRAPDADDVDDADDFRRLQAELAGVLQPQD